MESKTANPRKSRKLKDFGEGPAIQRRVILICSLAGGILILVAVLNFVMSRLTKGKFSI